MTVAVTKETFEAEVLKSDKPVLVDFWAEWCGPCRMLGPVLEELSNERADIKVCKVNVDEQQALAAQFNVMSIPTVIGFKGGVEVGKSVGFVPKDKLTAIVD